MLKVGTVILQLLEDGEGVEALSPPEIAEIVETAESAKPAAEQPVPLAQNERVGTVETSVAC